MWPAGKNRGGEPPLEPPPPDDPGWTDVHWLQPKNWLLDSQPCSPAADLASNANSNERAANTLQHEGFYALLANGEIADPAEVEAMVASLQSVMPLTSPEEARLHLSQNRWSLQETIQHVQADSLTRTLGAELKNSSVQKPRL